MFLMCLKGLVLKRASQSQPAKVTHRQSKDDHVTIRFRPWRKKAPGLGHPQLSWRDLGQGQEQLLMMKSLVSSFAGPGM